MINNDFMKRALIQAKLAFDNNEVPVGAVLVNYAGEVLVEKHNQMKSHNSPYHHAEYLAILHAVEKLKLERDQLIKATLYVTLEPCHFCTSLIALTKIGRVIYGASDPKGGAIENGAKIFLNKLCNHFPEVISGIEEEESAELLRQFFASKRNIISHIK